MPRLPLRLLGWIVAIALLALPVVGLLQGWFASSNWPVRTLSIKADYNLVTADRIRQAVLPHIRRGFFATRLDDVRNALDALPWVASASVRKSWPDTLELSVKERQAFAHWNGKSLIDTHGNVFTVPGAAGVPHLPYLSGPDGQHADVVTFYQAVRKELRAVSLKVTGVELNNRGGWRLDLANGSHLMLGSNDPKQRLARFISVYPGLIRTHAGPFLYADLRYPNGFAVRWPKGDKVTNAPSGAANS